MRWLVLAFLALALIACGDSYERQLKRLKSFVDGSQVGSSQDYWLIKRAFGVDDYVGLIFGYGSDLDACFEIAEALNQLYPAADYTCKPAN